MSHVDRKQVVNDGSVGGSVVSPSENDVVQSGVVNDSKVVEANEVVVEKPVQKTGNVKRVVGAIGLAIMLSWTALASAMTPDPTIRWNNWTIDSTEGRWEMLGGTPLMIAPSATDSTPALNQHALDNSNWTGDITTICGHWSGFILREGMAFIHSIKSGWAMAECSTPGIWRSSGITRAIPSDPGIHIDWFDTTTMASAYSLATAYWWCNDIALAPSIIG